MRKSFDTEFMAKVALDAIRGGKDVVRIVITVRSP